MLINFLRPIPIVVIFTAGYNLSSLRDVVFLVAGLVVAGIGAIVLAYERD